MLILLLLALWAREELNLRPHAYQAFVQKPGGLYLHAIPALRSGRLGGRRAIGAANRAQKRRQDVDGERSGDTPGNSARDTFPRPLGALNLQPIAADPTPLDREFADALARITRVILSAFALPAHLVGPREWR